MKESTMTLATRSPQRTRKPQRLVLQIPRQWLARGMLHLIRGLRYLDQVLSRRALRRAAGRAPR
jgi:hypothetical protein